MSSIQNEVEALFSGRPEPRVRPIFGRRMYAPESDDAEPDTSERVAADIEGLTIGILYRDASGRVSDRVIRCRTLRHSAGGYYLDAECTLRQAARTFRLDRIEEVIDYTTGEAIVDVRGFFANYIELEVDESGERDQPGRETRRPNVWLEPTSANPRVAAAFRDGARVLLFIALSDGELHDAEHAFIINYGVERLRRLPEPPHYPDEIVRRWIDNHVPTRAEALAALARVCRNDADGEDMAHAMIDLIIADGHASDGEMAIAWHIPEGA